MSRIQNAMAAYGGIIANLVWISISGLIIRYVYIDNEYIVVALWLFFTLHFAEAVSYLFVGDIYLVSDMANVAQAFPKLRWINFAIGSILTLLYIYTYTLVPKSLLLCILIWNIGTLLGMCVGRIVFTIREKITQGDENLDKQKIVKELKKIGIYEGMELEVHSSLSSFGYVQGGAESVIEAFMECVGSNGSIYMPALRLDPPMELTEEDKSTGITVKIKIIPENAIRTDMGIIADTFRSRSDVITGKGVIRTSGWGLHAYEAEKYGLDYVIHNGGKALLLGVDIYKLTAMHYMEDILPKEISDIFAPSVEVCKKYPSDEWFIETGEPPVKPWYTIQNMAYEKGIIRDGYIGKCKYMFFDIWDVVSLYRSELEKDPFKLYGLKER